MRQYFAIIKDSFRAALASRVLYLLLALITIFLLAIAPFHYRENASWKLVWQSDVKDPAALVERLLERKDDANHPGMQRIWQRLPEKLKQNLTADSRKKDDDRKNRKAMRTFGMQQNLIEALNDIIRDPEFYRESDWQQTRASSEEKELALALAESFDTDASRRLNRLLVGKAFGSAISRPRAVSLAAWYGPWPFGLLDVPSSRQRLAAQLGQIIPGYLDKFVLSIGLAVALLVTASIIPETFEPGSLNLLLSKPISRSGLFLAKFAGGCVFISLCATYLFAGLWLWLGLAIGVWQNAILYSIVLYIIVFGIYYSVSAFVGLVTRSTILSVVVTILFWATCFAIGTTYGILNTRMQNSRIISLLATENSVLQLNRSSQIRRWNEASKAWESVGSPKDKEAEMQMGMASFIAPFDAAPQPLGISQDPASGRVIVGDVSMTNPLTFNRQPIRMANDDKSPFKVAGKKFPTMTSQVVSGKDGLLMVTEQGKFYRFAAESPESDNDQRLLRELKIVSAEESDDPPQPIANLGPWAIAANRVTGELAAYSQGKLWILKPSADSLVMLRSASIDIQTDAEMSCLLSFGGPHVVMTMGNGEILLVDADSLTIENRSKPVPRYPVDQIASTDDGSRFFMLFGDRRLRVFDPASPEATPLASVAGQGSISAFSINAQDQLVVADRMDRVTRYRLPNLTKDQTLAPPGNWLENLFRYAVRPLYRMWPKPGEFYKTVAWLSTFDATDAADEVNSQNIDLRTQPRHENPWSPLTSGLAFMAVMLVLSCVYFSRKDY